MGPLVTQNELARTLGVSKSTMSGLIRRDDWPAGKAPPWSEADVEAIERWRAELQEDRSGKADAKAQAMGLSGGDGGSQRQKVETLLKLHRSRSAKVAADLAEGKVIDRATADLMVMNLASLFRTRVDSTRDTLLQDLDGDPAKNEPALRRRFNELLEGILADAEAGLERMDAAIAELAAKRRK